MKRMDFLCASPSSTAICTSQDHRSMVRQGIKQQNRPNSKPYIPCTSLNQIIPFNPKSLYEKTSKSSDNGTAGLYRRSSADIRDSSSSSSSTSRAGFRRRSSADISDVKSPCSSTRYLLSDTPYVDWIEHDDDDRYRTALAPISQTPRPRRSKARLEEDGKSSHSAIGWVSEPEPAFGLVNKPRAGKPKERSSSSSSSEHYHVPASSRKSSSSSAAIMVQEWVSESGNYVASLVPTTQNSNTKKVNIDAKGSPPLKSSSSARSRDQVVVLRVSIHCKGCEGKVRKHISKMEGVTSFNIDLAAKKVTIVGDVTPLGVLASISKVKNAQLWPSSPLYDPSPRWST